jgi:hypothetical protein|tara:strand:- start:44 stop:1420 length:1377 start_codon:yes stop_codon:yes gene_type:complete
MPQVNYETKIQNAVKKSANIDLNEPEVYIKGQLPKQIVDDHVPYDKTFSEAFLYRFTNLLNGKIYVGRHKGQPYDGYMFSSKDKDFKKDFMNPNSEWKYEVLQYGSYEYVGATENTLLINANAKDNDNYYNKSNGGSNIVLPRIKLLQSIVNDIRENKSYKGAEMMLTSVKNLPDNAVQVREFTLDKDHVNTLRDIINDKRSLEHLTVIILKDRTYCGMTGDLIIDGNHSIAGAIASETGDEGIIPTLQIPKHLHEDLTDMEVDLLATMLNPRDQNPTLPTDLPTIAKHVCAMRLQGLDSNGKEIQEYKDNFHLSKKQKTKVSNLANEMYAKVVPNTSTWINYSVGEEGRKIKEQIKNEHITNDNKTGIFSKCYSTAKYGSQNDLYEMMIWNRDNPHNKITTYKIRWYHKDEEYKKIWKDKWQNNNEFMIDKLLKNHGIKRDWTYLKPTRSKLTTKKS